MNKIKSELHEMYEHQLENTTVANLNEGIAKKLEEEKAEYTDNPSGKIIMDKLNLYGRYVKKQANTLDDVCER